MIRAIRWRSLIPRLMLLAVVLLASQYALGRIARRQVVGSLQSATDASVDLAHAHVSLRKRQLTLSDLRFGDVANSSRPVVEIDRCTLGIAASPLLNRRIVVDRGVLTGLRLELPGVFAGRPAGQLELPRAAQQATTASINWPRDTSIEEAGRWLAGLSQRFEFALIEQLKSVERTAELCRRWPVEAAEFDQRIEDLHHRAAALQQEIETAQLNPLRKVEFFQRLPDEIDTLRRELVRATADVNSLVQHIDANQQKIVRLRRDDVQFVHDELEFEPVDARSLTAYLLREQVTAPVEQVVSTLRWVRRQVPAQRSSGGRPARGENVYFAGGGRSPSVLFDTLHLHGSARIGGQPVELRGTLNDLSNSPFDHPQPIRLRVQATGSTRLDLQVCVDRTGAVARDEMFLDCRGMLLPEHTLGRREELQLTMAPSIGTLSVSVLVEGEKLSGDIQLVEKQLQIAPIFVGQLAEVPIAAALQDTLADIHSLAIRVSLGGTLERPTCSLWSNLGPAVAEAMDRALQHAGDEHARALLVRANRQVDERLSTLRQQAGDQRAKLHPQLAATADTLQSISGEHTPSPRITHQQLGRRLPEGSLFR